MTFTGSLSCGFSQQTAERSAFLEVINPPGRTMRKGVMFHESDGIYDDVDRYDRGSGTAYQCRERDIYDYMDDFPRPKRQ